MEHALSRVENALTDSADDLTLDHPADGGDALLARLSAAAVRHVPGTVCAGLVMRCPDGELVSRAPTHPEVAELDALQVHLGQGPCVEALAAGATGVEELGDECRWPAVTSTALRVGVRSLLSVALPPHGDAPGTLNLYASAPGAFDSASCVIARLFALQAGVAVHGVSQVARRDRAAVGDVVGLAKGILMERFTLDDQQAFDALAGSSRGTDVALATVARWVVDEARHQARA